MLKKEFMNIELLIERGHLSLYKDKAWHVKKKLDVNINLLKKGAKF